MARVPSVICPGVSCHIPSIVNALQSEINRGWYIPLITQHLFFSCALFLVCRTNVHEKCQHFSIEICIMFIVYVYRVVCLGDQPSFLRKYEITCYEMIQCTKNDTKYLSSGVCEFRGCWEVLCFLPWLIFKRDYEPKIVVHFLFFSINVFIYVGIKLVVKLAVESLKKCWLKILYKYLCYLQKPMPIDGVFSRCLEVKQVLPIR